MHVEPPKGVIVVAGGLAKDRSRDLTFLDVGRYLLTFDSGYRYLHSDDRPCGWPYQKPPLFAILPPDNFRLQQRAQRERIRLPLRRQHRDSFRGRAGTHRNWRSKHRRQRCCVRKTGAGSSRRR